nr:cytochrome P450 71AP13-like [Ziziphus jujuba var. spinosa]
MAFLQWLKEPIFLFAFLFLLVWLKFIFKEKSTKKQLNLPPSPSKLPIIGNLHQLNSSMPHLSLFSLAKKYGPILFLQLGQIPTVVVSSARLAKEVLKTHDLALCSRPQFFSAKHLLYNCTDVAFSPYGAYWRHIRKICILEVLGAKRVQSYRFVREEELARLVHRIADSYPGTTNLSKFLETYANNIICRVAFGRDFSEGEYDQHGLQKTLVEFQELLGGLSLGDFFPSMEEIIHSFTGMKSRLQKTFRRFDLLLDQIVNEHLNPMREKEEHKDLVNVLLDIQKNRSLEMPLTMDNAKAIILDMFSAGTDTTFRTIDWGMTELIMNPKVMEKAQAEVRRVVGERRVVIESDLSQLHYMKAVIKEILRLHPPAPLLLPRESMEHVTIDGYNIPAKTRIFVNVWAIGRDQESWEDPEIFEPERFMGSTIDFKGLDFELIPFGAGRRGCPGIAFGTASIELALAQLLHSFDWELPLGVTAKELDMTEVFGITMHRLADLIVLAKPHFS